MTNTGCQESLLIQITQELRLTETPCHYAIVTERKHDERNTGSSDFHVGVRHITLAHSSVAKRVTWPHITSKGQRSAPLCLQEGNPNTFGEQQQGIQMCSLTRMYIES